MKYRLIAAMLAAFFMLPIVGLTAYAAPLDDISEAPIIAEDEPEADETLDIEMGDIHDTDTGKTLPEHPIENPDAVELPALPPGTGTIIDYNTDPDGRLFYTIITPDEHVFYLVIDKSSNTDNIYFLNAVTIADLAALAEIPATPGGTLTPPPPVTEAPELPAETPPPAEQEQPQGGGNMGMYIFIIILAVAGGGAGWYFKIYRPKQQGAASGEEYDPSMDEAENDYTDDWGEDSEDDNGSLSQDEESEDEE